MPEGYWTGIKDGYPEIPGGCCAPGYDPEWKKNSENEWEIYCKYEPEKRE